MYIRKSTQINRKTGAAYTTYRLVESYRNAEGKVRQQTLLNLGCHFEIAKPLWKLLADRIEEICSCQKSLIECDVVLEQEAQRIAKLVMQTRASQSAALSTREKASTDHCFNNNDTKDFHTVDINSVNHLHVRKIGNEHIGLQAAKQIHLPEILQASGFSKKQTNIALGSIIGRLIHPRSERSTHRYLTKQSALDELLDTDFSALKAKSLYQISDRLLSHKKAIEAALFQREKDLFQLDEVITLYDLTNTYFEGQCGLNSKANYGRSKEKRSDCRLVTLGLTLDSSGFIKQSKIFPGNISEPKTLQAMLNTLKIKKGMTVVMDAGIATEANLVWLNEEGYSYIVVSRKRSLVMPTSDEKVILKEDPKNKVEAVLIKNTQTNEMELYCHSQAKEAKSTQMIDKASQRYETELNKLANGLSAKGTTKKYEKVVERLGRLKEKYKKVAKWYEVNLLADQEKKYAETLTWQRQESDDEKQARGIYCLRTNRDDLDANTFWRIYTTLTDLESAFRSLKTELGMRPVFHQKESRVDGHIFIAILAYHLLHTIRYQLKQKGIHDSFTTIRDLLDTHIRLTTSMKNKEGKTISIRKTSQPDTHQALIYKALNIEKIPGNTQKSIV